MSAAGLQQAIAQLIRLPEHNRGDDLPTFIEKFDLNAHEREQVRLLSQEFNVAKFGRIMRSARERKISGLIRLSQSYMTDEIFEKLWIGLFEPKATRVKFNELPSAFLEFLLYDEQAIALLNKELPDFVRDILKFESAQGHFRMKHFQAEREVPEGSRLVHADFVVLDLNFDIQALRARIAKEKPERGTLKPDFAPNHLLFIRKGNSFDCRIFKIDAETKAFLAGELQNPPLGLSIPVSYGQLVELGLCRAIH